MTTRPEELATFYEREAARLHAIVASRTHAPTEEVIEDACQYAWLALTRREDVTLDARGASWLITVATHEAWRLARPRDVPVGAFRSQDVDAGELPEPPCLEASVPERLLELAEHESRVEHLRTLDSLERRDLLLKAAGYSYREIAELTGTTYTQVNRHLAHARNNLRAGRE